MSNPIIQTDIADILQEIKSDQKEILKEVGNLKQEVNEVKVSLEAVKGDIKALDTKVDQLDKRISNSEFTNRGILIGLVVIILGGRWLCHLTFLSERHWTLRVRAKVFGLMGNS